MQQEQFHASIFMGKQAGSIFQASGEREVILNLTSYRRGLDYPCGCRHCRDLKAAPRARANSTLAAIDVYDLPDDTDFNDDDYFH